MKKFVCLALSAAFILLCGCENASETQETRFLLNTVVNIKAIAPKETVSGALDLCAYYEKLLSRTDHDSDVYKINHTDGFCETDSETLKIIKDALCYCEKTDGRFDITVAPASSLWDFTGETLPDFSALAEAIKRIDYKKIVINGDEICTGGTEIDLGAVAKGYICDRVRDYLVSNGVTDAVINLGGNVTVMGKYDNIGIAKPFSETTAVRVRAPDKTYVTSGIYQRYIEADGKIYHHILDKNTGCGVENSLASVTVITDSSFDADALSTCCMLLGLEEAKALVQSTENTEAVFIERDGTVTCTDGLKKKNGVYVLK